MDSKKIKVWAHRGASGYAPENTMDAFRKAIEMKADGIELDVHLTKDGEVVVIHDEVLDRVSDGTGRVQDFTCNELKKFNFNKIHPEYEKEEIPTLEEVYQLIKPTDLTKNRNTHIIQFRQIAGFFDLADRIFSDFLQFFFHDNLHSALFLSDICLTNYFCDTISCGGFVSATKNAESFVQGRMIPRYHPDSFCHEY